MDRLINLQKIKKIFPKWGSIFPDWAQYSVSESETDSDKRHFGSVPFHMDPFSICSLSIL